MLPERIYLYIPKINASKKYVDKPTNMSSTYTYTLTAKSMCTISVNNFIILKRKKHTIRSYTVLEICIALKIHSFIHWENYCLTTTTTHLLLALYISRRHCVSNYYDFFSLSKIHSYCSIEENKNLNKRRKNIHKHAPEVNELNYSLITSDWFGCLCCWCYFYWVYFFLFRKIRFCFESHSKETGNVHKLLFWKMKCQVGETGFFYSTVPYWNCSSEADVNAKWLQSKWRRMIHLRVLFLLLLLLLYDRHCAVVRDHTIVNECE